MDFDALLRNPPALHADRDGNAVSWGAGERLLRYLNQTVRAGDVTLETGAGLSTLVFAMNRCRHTTVVPDQGQVDRILAWCAANDVPADTLTFKVGPSEDVLPGLEPTPLDVVLIDGAHGFPLPLVDWLYAGRRLRAGGTLVVDDVKIWTSRVLYDFLAREPQWRIDCRKDLEFFAAKRVAAGSLGEWLDQPFVLHRSYDKVSTSARRRLVSSLVTAATHGGRAMALARGGEWAELRSRVGRWSGAAVPARSADEAPQGGRQVTTGSESSS